MSAIKFGCPNCGGEADSRRYSHSWECKSGCGWRGKNPLSPFPPPAEGELRARLQVAEQRAAAAEARADRLAAALRPFLPRCGCCMGDGRRPVGGWQDGQSYANVTKWEACPGCSEARAALAEDEGAAPRPEEQER